MPVQTQCPPAAGPAPPSSHTALSATAGRHHRQLQLAKRTYLQFVWGMSFGIVAALATPLLALATLVLGVSKAVMDALRMRQHS
jgi:hypothetical protein